MPVAAGTGSASSTAAVSSAVGSGGVPAAGLLFLTPVVTWVIDPPRLKWVIALDAERIDVNSLEQVTFSVFADSAGTVYNPTGAAVSAAFIPSSAKPQAGDWKTCSWDTSLIGTYRAACLVGAGGAVQLAAGEFYAWLRIVDPGGETVIRQVGQLIVQ